MPILVEKELSGCSKRYFLEIADEVFVNQEFYTLTVSLAFKNTITHCLSK